MGKITTLTTALACLLSNYGRCVFYIQFNLKCKPLRLGIIINRSDSLCCATAYLMRIVRYFTSLFVLVSLILRSKRNLRKLDVPIAVRVVLVIREIVLMILVQKINLNLQ